MPMAYTTWTIFLRDLHDQHPYHTTTPMLILLFLMWTIFLQRPPYLTLAIHDRIPLTKTAILLNCVPGCFRERTVGGGGDKIVVEVEVEVQMGEEPHHLTAGVRRSVTLSHRPCHFQQIKSQPFRHFLQANLPFGMHRGLPRILWCNRISILGSLPVLG